MEAWLSSNIDILSGTTVANILVVIGFIIYYTGLKSFAEIQKDDFTAENILKIRRAAVCGVIALLLGYIPFIGGFGGWILNLVMYFMLASAYGYLRYSPVFNIRAKAGARLLRSAAIMYIIGMFIPIIGGLFSFMGLLMTIIGWGRIRKGGPIAAVASVATNITYNIIRVQYRPRLFPRPILLLPLLEKGLNFVRIVERLVKNIKDIVRIADSSLIKNSSFASSPMPSFSLRINL